MKTIEEQKTNIKVLIGCETSGTVRDAFERKGFDSWSCDLLKADTITNRHIIGDIRDVMHWSEWDLLYVAHPSCTRMCNSGSRWLIKAPPNKTLQEMWDELDEGVALFKEIMAADIPIIAIENPVMHYHAKSRIWGENWKKASKNDGTFIQQKTVQPYEFADSLESEDNIKKRTCLWLKNLPPLKATGTLTRETARDDIHKASPGKDRWKFRSKFHVGMAEAMAEQWGNAALTFNSAISH